MRLVTGLLHRAKVAVRAAQPLKLALVVRTDLRMSKGKTAAQSAHAAIACYELAARSAPQLLAEWLATGQAKVVLRIESLDELERVQMAARAAGVGAACVADAGRTELVPGTVTVLGIGPAYEADVNALVGALKLL